MFSNTLTCSCVSIDALADVWVEEVIKILFEGFVINMCADVVIDTLTGVQVDVAIDFVSDVGVEVYGNVSVVEMIDLWFSMSAP